MLTQTIIYVNPDYYLCQPWLLLMLTLPIIVNANNY